MHVTGLKVNQIFNALPLDKGPGKDKDGCKKGFTKKGNACQGMRIVTALVCMFI